MRKQVAWALFRVPAAHTYIMLEKQYLNTTCIAVRSDFFFQSISNVLGAFRLLLLTQAYTARSCAPYWPFVSLARPSLIRYLVSPPPSPRPVYVSPCRERNFFLLLHPYCTRGRHQSLTGVVPFSEQEITDASVSQDGTTTTITFTRLLAPMAAGKQVISAVPGDETIIIWAFGPDNELDYHGQDPNRGDVTVDLFCGDRQAADGTPSPAAGTPSPAAETRTLAPGAAAAPSAAPTPAVSSAAPVAGGRGELGDTPAPAGAVRSAAPTLAATMAPANMTMAPTNVTMTPAPTVVDTASPDGDRGIGGPDTSGTPAPSVLSTMVTETPTAGPSASTPADGIDGEDGDGEDGDDQDTDGASSFRIGGGGGWAAAAVAGVVTVLAALSL